MSKRLVLAAVLFLLTLLWTVSLSNGAFSQGTSLAGGVSVLFPGDPDFAAVEEDFLEETGLEPGTSLAEEFSRRSPIGQYRSSSGLVGTFFEEAFLLLSLRQVSHIVYGTLTVPQGATLGGRDFSGEYGIVVYGLPLVIVLAEQESGELAAFVVTSSAPPQLPAYILELLFQLITPPLSRPPSQPPSSLPFFGFHLSLKCQELPFQQEVDVSVGSGEALVEISDDSGAALFVVKEAGLGTLAISSFGPPLQFLVSALNYFRLGLAGAERETEVAIPVGPEFTLLVQAEEERAACIEAQVERSSQDEYRIVGVAYHS